jgi:hypothetical protein
MKPYTSLVSSELLVPASPETSQNLFDWIGNNAQAIDASACNEKFHEAGLLQQDEHIAFAFKTGRDSLYLTNKRLFLIDVQVSVSCNAPFSSLSLLKFSFMVLYIGFYWKEERVPEHTLGYDPCLVS